MSILEKVIAEAEKIGVEIKDEVKALIAAAEGDKAALAHNVGDVAKNAAAEVVETAQDAQVVIDQVAPK